ncbi:CBO0543 family protein [Virgibacillus sp. L01]|uniref:CBO0543 family protein n=1 Tax=Virgibacillus sp. L01 TaxID=3457429 RepID=UPI003FD5D995
MVVIIIQNLIPLYELSLLNVSLSQLIEDHREFNDTLKAYWHQKVYLTPRWWFLVMLSLLPAIIWWMLVNKKRIIEITAFGLFYGVAAIILDSIGSNALAWTYPYILSPYLRPQLYPYDVGVVIISYMFCYQLWSDNFKKFLIFSGLLAAFLAFAAEPIMVWLGLYKAIYWKHIYSFPIYWLLGIICWGIIMYFKKLEQER